MRRNLVSDENFYTDSRRHKPLGTFGFAVMVGLIKAKRLDRWTAAFLVSTLATSVTGFLFRFTVLLRNYRWHHLGGLARRSNYQVFWWASVDGVAVRRDPQ